MKNKKNILLAIVSFLIIAGIVYLERQKPPTISNSTAQDVLIQPIAPQKPLPQAVQDQRKNILAAKAQKYKKAKEIVDPQGFINSDAFKLSDLVGKKVILIDFWTYSCINCQRTLPYLKSWYDKYKDKGLVIVGIHTPEFDFEKKYENVLSATKRLGVAYPVVLDSNRGTWNAYDNQYWPREYLIDIDGYVVHDHIGEGEYDKTERAIQDALKERATVLGLDEEIDMGISNPADAITMNSNQVGSPETYFGAFRNEYLGNGMKYESGVQNLTASEAPRSSVLYLNGLWNFSNEFAENKDQSGKIFYKYTAKNVYLVASSQNGVKAKILLDGKPIDASQRGKDVDESGTVMIKENRLYDIVHGSDYGTHTLEIDIQGAGLDAYTFTFG
jgi:thiol-disulfide isomerase/thioredoxin